MSVISVASRAISDDRNVFQKEWRDLNINYHEMPCFNVKYVMRVLFRLIDVMARISFLSITWVAFKGYVTAALIIIDCVIVAKFSCKNHKFILFFFVCLFV